MDTIKYFKIFVFFGLVLSACESTVIENSSQASSPSTPPTTAVTSSPVKISQTQSQPNSIFSSILPVVKAKTKVPVRLPAYIPESEEPNPIYALVETVTPSQYKIMLAFTKDCNGGNACRLGGIFAETITPKNPPVMGKNVSLANGITGYFVDATCGANCSDATLTWEQNSGRYTVAIKAGEMTTLVKMANSVLVEP